MVLLWLAVLIVTFTQLVFHWCDTRALDGTYVKPIRPQWNAKSWFNGSFQDSMNSYTEANIGFHDLLTRTRNQLDYSLFGEIHAQDVIEGRQHHLFSVDNIKREYGIDSSWRVQMRRSAVQLKALQDTFALRHKLLMVVLAPGKAHALPEYLPTGFDSSQRSNNDYHWMRKLFDDYGIRYIDFNAYFLRAKNNFSFPLFTRGGAHWSMYGSIVAADSMTHYMQAALDKRFVSYDWSQLNTSTQPRFDDDDLYRLLNLFQPPPRENYSYPIVKVNDSTGFKPNVLVIGDSFYWQCYHLGFPQAIYSPHFSYWYYGHVAWPQSERAGYEVQVSSLDLRHEIEQRDVVMLLDGESNYTQLGHWLVNDIYGLYNAKQ